MRNRAGPDQMSPARLRREARRDEVMRLRMAGATYDAIASHMNINKCTVKRDVDRRLKNAAKDCPNTQMYREFQRVRLEQLLLKWWPKAEAGNRDALDRVLKIMEMLSKLHGLNSPQEIQHLGLEEARSIKVQLMPAIAPQIAGQTKESEADDSAA